MLLLVGLSSAMIAGAASAVFAPGGVAIRGYDPVAYFVDGKPTPGRDEFATDWMGAKWKFASQANLDRFKAEPAKYAPQYGGYCAYGTAKGHLAPTEPSAWSVVDGKLYLNYNEKVSKLWQKDIPGYKAAADRQYSGLLKAPAEAE
ncbi:MAG: YHS domain-containing (seleno)protein [Nevskia sp.]|nr:YHS domain-containing (seleno)protein [Nevskia sp.]